MRLRVSNTYFCLLYCLSRSNWEVIMRSLRTLSNYVKKICFCFVSFCKVSLMGSCAFVRVVVGMSSWMSDLLVILMIMRLEKQWKKFWSSQFQTHCSHIVKISQILSLYETWHGFFWIFLSFKAILLNVWGGFIRLIILREVMKCVEESTDRPFTK